MPQLLVRNVEEQLKVRLQRRAKRNGRSMEEEAREILRHALREETPQAGLGTELASMFAGIGLPTDIAELRGHVVHPTEFEP